MEELEKYIGKKVRIFLTNGWQYTIDISDVENNCIKGIDKFNEPVSINKNNISSIVPVSGTSHGAR